MPGLASAPHLSPIAHAVTIEAPPATVWAALTDTAAMAQWMGDPEMQITVETDWRVGAPIVIRGVHHGPFVNTGTVEVFEASRRLRYTHRSSVSRLPDDGTAEATLDFTLAATASGTELTLVITGARTFAIHKHLDFYWRVTLGVLAGWVRTR